jgi:hypothetical protein
VRSGHPGTPPVDQPVGRSAGTPFPWVPVEDVVVQLPTEACEAGFDLPPAAHRGRVEQ